MSPATEPRSPHRDKIQRAAIKVSGAIKALVDEVEKNGSELTETELQSLTRFVEIHLGAAGQRIALARVVSSVFNENFELGKDLSAVVKATFPSPAPVYRKPVMAPEPKPETRPPAARPAGRVFGTNEVLFDGPPEAPSPSEIRAAARTPPNLEGQNVDFLDTNDEE